MEPHLYRGTIDLRDFYYNCTPNDTGGRKAYTLVCRQKDVYEEWSRLLMQFHAANQTDPRITQQQAAPSKCGWLDLNGKRRWVVLRDEMLYVYSDVTLAATNLKRSASSVVPLLNCSVAAAGGGRVQLSMVGQAGVLELSSKMPAEQVEWTAVLQQAAERARRSFGEWCRDHPVLWRAELRSLLLKSDCPYLFVCEGGKLSWHVCDPRVNPAVLAASLGLQQLPEEEGSQAAFVARLGLGPHAGTPGWAVGTPVDETRRNLLVAPLLAPSAAHVQPLLPLDGLPAWASDQLFPLEDLSRHTSFYRIHFLDKPHVNFLGEDAEGEPVVVALQKRRNSYKKAKVLVRTKKGDTRLLLPPPLEGLAGLQQARPEMAAWKLARCSAADLVKAQIAFEEKLIVNKYKFGVLYARAGQTNEDQFYNNNPADCIPAYGQFLSWLGQVVQLQGWSRFRGGLNIKNGSTGETSVYTEYEGCEIMFHVATMIPFQPADVQQVERKRHLGNDVVVLVFREPGAPPLDPAAFKSQFNHVFVAVEPEPSAAGPAYRLAVALKQGVVEHGPPLPTPPAPGRAYPASPALRNWLLAKMINAERAAMYAPDFRGKMSGTRRSLLAEMVQAHPPDPPKVQTNRSLLQRSFSPRTINDATSTATGLASKAKGLSMKGFRAMVQKTNTFRGGSGGSSSSSSGSGSSSPAAGSPTSPGPLTSATSAPMPMTSNSTAVPGGSVGTPPGPTSPQLRPHRPAPPAPTALASSSGADSGGDSTRSSGSSSRAPPLVTSGSSGQLPSRPSNGLPPTPKGGSHRGTVSQAASPAADAANMQALEREIAALKTASTASMPSSPSSGTNISPGLALSPLRTSSSPSGPASPTSTSRGSGSRVLVTPVKPSAVVPVGPPTASTSPDSAPASAVAPAPTPAAPSAAPKERRVRALWAFKATQPGDLEFQAGEIITVVGVVEQWLEGRIGNRQGLLPSNYVQDLPN